MQQFAVGQRWVSAGELHLGIGMVLEVEFRTVSIMFPATGETRVYSKQTAPLSRVEFGVGDQVTDHEDRSYRVVEVENRSDLLFYHCVDDSGHQVRLSEGKLSNFLKLNHPLQRLLNGQIDKNKWFELRARVQKYLSVLSQSDLQGLSGCRTSLIDHQLYIAHEVAGRFAPRVLLADEVGLGKTIEAGLILHQQLLNERAQRVLIVVPESLVHQWLVEMMRRFNLLFSVFDEARCEALEGVDETHVEEVLDNPFHSEQLVLCSLEFLLDNPRRLNQSLDGDWDMLVVDEAHHLVWEDGNPGPEYQMVEKLAQTIPSVLLLTATPEQLGKESHFARLRLLDPDRFSDLAHFIEDESHFREIADIVDLLNDSGELSQPQQELLKQTVAEGDNQFSIEHIDDDDSVVAEKARHELVEHLLDRHGTGRVLFRNTRHVVKGFPGRQLLKYALPCPEIYSELYLQLSDEQELENWQWYLSPEVILQALGAQPAKWLQIDPRVTWLIDFLKQHRKNKVLVICSSTDTVLTLVQEIRDQTGISVGAFHEGLSLVERDRSAAWFADQETGAQALICSEIGSEGRNFQFAHDLVMFDIPANPDLLEQRIGRLDRIGQTETISIHVPFLENTAQQVMLQWMHEALDAFEQTCPAGPNVYRQLQAELLRALRQPGEDHDEFMVRSKTLHDQLNDQLLKGRDRLLEYNSCRPQQAQQLRQQAQELDTRLDIGQFMEALYDSYGISYEIHSPGCWVLKPTDNMLAKIPGLPDDGMTVTYDRDIALANEDVRYLTWAHPLVRTLMDMVVSGEMGNTSVIAVKFRGVQPGTLLLDCFFRIEIANIALSNAQRYLPENLIRLCIDESGKTHQRILTAEKIDQGFQYVDPETAIKVVKSREKVIKQLQELAEDKAAELLPEKQRTAVQQAQQMLGREINRLVALQTINPNVRDEEIDFFKQQLTAVEKQISTANIRLDAVRVLVAV